MRVQNMMSRRRWLAGMASAVVAGGLWHRLSRASDPTGRWVPEPDGHGLKDTTTGLIWGYDFGAVHEFVRPPLSGHYYPWGSDLLQLLVAWPQDPANHPGYYQEEWSVPLYYPDFSNEFFGRNDTDWRIPTADELSNAVLGGLGYVLDFSPEGGHQENDDLSSPNPRIWSATPAGKIQGRDAAYRVHLWTGELIATTVGSWAGRAIPVRGVAPGGGGGTKKGGGKK